MLDSPVSRKAEMVESSMASALDSTELAERGRQVDLALSRETEGDAVALSRPEHERQCNIPSSVDHALYRSKRGRRTYPHLPAHSRLQRELVGSAGSIAASPPTLGAHQAERKVGLNNSVRTVGRAMF